MARVPGADRLAAALDRHVALVGFMGSGKSTLGAAAAARMGREFFDVDAAIEEAAGDDIATVFRERGEPAFRALEQEETLRFLERPVPSVLALGGGAVTSAAVRDALREHAIPVWVEVDVDGAWQRVRGSDRPLAQDEAGFRRLHEERLPLYEEVAHARAHDADDVVLAAGGIHVGSWELPQAGALVVDASVLELYGDRLQLASTHTVPPGEEAKSAAVAERLWSELRLDRGGTIVAAGGGCTTDVAGFVAATYMRGIDWIAVPTTLVGQVDAAIGGKTGIDLPGGKNLVGAFHWPVRTVIDPAVLRTLPERERLNGLAEVVKTGLLAGEPLWELPEQELVRRCAAFKTAVCLRDPHERGERAILNLGHTFAHALEAAAGYELPHGQAVALGLVAALRLSGLDTAVVEELLRPEPARVDPERAWQALGRDKKAAHGRPRLVLLDAPGRPRYGVELPEDDVRAALRSLIAG